MSNPDPALRNPYHGARIRKRDRFRDHAWRCRLGMLLFGETHFVYVWSALALILLGICLLRLQVLRSRITAIAEAFKMTVTALSASRGLIPRRHNKITVK